MADLKVIEEDLIRLKVDPEKDNAKFNEKKGRKKKYPSQNYSNDKATYKVLNYCLDQGKMPEGAYRCYGAPNTADAEEVAAAFDCMRKFHGQDFGRQLNHFVISIKRHYVDELEVAGLKEITEAYVEPIAQDHQLVYAIHEGVDKENNRVLHSHIVFNHVNYKTGLRHRRDNGFLDRELERLETIIEEVIERKANDTTGGAFNE